MNPIDRLRLYVESAPRRISFVEPIHALEDVTGRAELRLEDLTALLLERDALKLALDTLVDETKKRSQPLTKLYLLLVEADNGLRDREGVGIGHWIKPAHEQQWSDAIKWLRDSVVVKTGDKL
jgi:hypothetical protein